MCALASGRDPSLLVHENAHGAVLLDRFGSRRGHLLVVAKRHVENVSAFEWEEYAELQRLGFDACRVLEGALQPKRVYVAVLGASTAMATSYPHYHVHLVPICEDDARARPAQVFSWSAGVVIYEPQEAAELVAQLGSVWPRGQERLPTNARLPTAATR
jgi:diadenosine tetraphosphate (Ap4A) HIT family hydrolase